MEKGDGDEENMKGQEGSIFTYQEVKNKPTKTSSPTFIFQTRERLKYFFFSQTFSLIFFQINPSQVLKKKGPQNLYILD